MDWQTAIKGLVAILAITGLGFYANVTQSRNAAKFRARREADASHREGTNIHHRANQWSDTNQ